MTHAPAFRRISRVLALTLTLLMVSGAVSRADDEAQTIASKVGDAERLEGPLTFHLDRTTGKVWLELTDSGTGGTLAEVLYTEGLATGLGSNPVGLDRGQLGATRWVRFRRVADRVLLEEPNLQYRAETENAAEAKAVEQSFATSVLWAQAIEAEEGNRVLVDFTSFVVRDAHGVVERLAATDQGSFRLDGDRSVVDFDHCLGFPRNVELEAVLTFAGSKPGSHVRSTTPSPDSITLIQHHSFVALPEPGYRPRRFDPRAGSFAIDYLDYAVPLDESMRKQWIVRHRLQKTDPWATRSTVVEPIVYYVDAGAPEPIQSALIEGASWWAEAFEAAGFENAFRVEVMPEDAHPLDVRYNVIQWVHRSTRGWSYGGGVVDPRTGEMLKGHVSLGSLRVRQDIRIFEGLLGTAKTGSGEPDDPVELALARIRQLSAHEVGHTLGLAHNFAASTYDDRASVMDYPAPWVRVASDGGLDVSRAYGVGVGSWDRHAIRWAYAEVAPGTDEAAELRSIAEEGIESGLRFASDADARAPGSAHPLANLWDNGADATAELEEVLAVRAQALDRFDDSRIAPGRPLAELEETLAPVYFYHRYQVEAAARQIAGVDYSYALRGDEQASTTPVSATDQWRALEVLLSALEPDALDLPDDLVERLLPRPFGSGTNRELFEKRTRPLFDPLAAAGSASDLVLRFVLQPERLARLVELHRRDPGLPALEAVLGRIVDATWPPEADGGRAAELRRVTQRALVDRLIAVEGGSSTAPEVRLRVRAAMEDLRSRLGGRHDDRIDRANRELLAADLTRALEAPAPARGAVPASLDLPPGSPIGGNAGQPDAAFCSLGTGPW